MPSFTKIALVVAAGLLGIAANAQNLPACRLLVENRNDLWLAQANGSAISRITSDGQLKPAAALQPDGKLLAYSTLDPLRDVVLSDAAGRILDQVSTTATEPVVDLKWISPSLLRAAVHQGPNYSQFYFFSLEQANRLARSPVTTASGADCAVSPAGKQLACIAGDTVTLNGRDMYFATGPFESSTIVQTSMVSLGSSLITITSPILRVDFKDQTANSVTLRVTTPDNQSQEQRVQTGQSMVVMSDAGGGIIGLEAVRTTDPYSVKLVVRKSNTGRTSFEGNLAWDTDGNRIAVVESNDAGQRTLVLLARQMGQAAIQGQGAVDAKIALPVQGPVSAVRFLSSTVVRVDGAHEAVELNITANGKVRSPTYSIKPLPSAPASPHLVLGGEAVVATIRDWSCP